MTVVLVCFFVCILLQLGMAIMAWRLFHRLESRKSDRPISVSIVIAAHNEANNISRLLDSIANQNHDDFEVILVDDRSTDQTVQKASVFSKVLDLKIIKIEETPQDWNAKKHAMTQGVAQASNEILLLIDADCEANSKNWINAMTQPFSNPDCDIVLGFSPYFSKKGLLNSFIQFETYYTALKYLAFAISGHPYMGVGRNLAYRRSFFNKQKGLSEIKDIMGGDDDLFINAHATRLNTHIAIGEDSLVYSVPKEDFSSYFKQKLRHLSVGKKYRLKSIISLAIVDLSLIGSWVLGLVLLLWSIHGVMVSAALILKLVSGLLLSSFVLKRLGQKNILPFVSFFEVFFVIYYIVVGLIATVRKKIRWI